MHHLLRVSPACRYTLQLVNCELCYWGSGIMATTSVAMISLPQLHNSFVLPRFPNPVSVSRLMLAAGRGSSLALEFKRILANPRWFDAWLWIQEKETESSTWSASGTERDEGVSIGVLLAPKAKHQTVLKKFCSVPFFGDHLHIMRYN